MMRDGWLMKLPIDWRSRDEQVHETRIADIGRRANRLLKAGFYAVEEVRWLAEFVRAGNCNLIEIEWLLANAERLAFDDGDLPK